MSSPRSDPGATIAARGQRRAAPAKPAPRAVPLSRFHALLPGPLARVPIAALLAWAGIFTITAVVILAPTLRSADAIERLEEDDIAASDAGPSRATAVATTTRTAAPEPPKSSKAPKADLDSAQLAGTDALAQLAQRFPEDAAVLRELFLAQATDKKNAAAALRTARRLIEVAPGDADDDDVRRALRELASGPTESSAVALDLIAHEMGARGPDLLFEIANNGPPLPKTRAASLLANPEVRKNATPALLIANDLRASFPCARKALLSRARSDGDARSIQFLKPLANTACGGVFRRGPPCFACFTPADRAEILRIIEAIEGRSPRPAGSGAPRRP